MLGPLPAIDVNSYPAYELFTACQTRMEYGAMDGRVLGIPRHELKVEAEARGITLSEYVLDDIRVCETVLVEQSIERIKTETPKT